MSEVASSGVAPRQPRGDSTGGQPFVRLAALVAPGCAVVGPEGAALVRLALDRLARVDGIPLTGAVLHLRSVAAAVAAASDTFGDIGERDRGHADMPNEQVSASSSAWMSTETAAREAGVSQRQVRRWAAAGRLGHVPRVNGALQINAVALTSYLIDRELQ